MQFVDTSETFADQTRIYIAALFATYVNTCRIPSLHHHNSAITYSSDVARATQDLSSKTANQLTISVINIHFTT